jgi:HEAT repeat protein
MRILLRIAVVLSVVGLGVVCALFLTREAGIPRADEGVSDREDYPAESEDVRVLPKAAEADLTEAAPADSSSVSLLEPADANDDIRAELARFKDKNRPLRQRRRDISILAKRGDTRSIEILMALGDENTYLNWAAVEALGRCLKPEVTEYLKGKLESDRKRVMCAAIRSYARHMGEAAVPELTALLKKNRTRPDGWEVQIQSEIVKVLAGLRDPKTVPALAEELTRYKESNWNLNYGSIVVAALGRVGTPNAHKAIKKYADGLAGMKPEDPMARKYYEDKIAEARSAIKGDVNEDLFKREL